MAHAHRNLNRMNMNMKCIEESNEKRNKNIKAPKNLNMMNINMKCIKESNEKMNKKFKQQKLFA